MQIVVVVLASLHSSLLEAFDLFIVSSVRVCTILVIASAALYQRWRSGSRGHSEPVKCVCWLWEFVDHVLEAVMMSNSDGGIMTVGRHASV